jgi:hypothetical protein
MERSVMRNLQIETTKFLTRMNPLALLRRPRVAVASAEAQAVTHRQCRWRNEEPSPALRDEFTEGNLP